MASFKDLYATTDDVLSFGQAWARGTLFDDPATHELMRHRFHTFGLPTSMAVLVPRAGPSNTAWV